MNSAQPDDGHLALIGAGVMGETLLAGLLRAGWDVSSIVGADRRGFRRDELRERYGISMVSDREAARGAGTVLLVVKPQDVADVLPGIGEEMPPGTLVISLCAGVSTATLEAGLPLGTPVVRVMPNTPAQVAEGMAAVSGGSHAQTQHLARASEIMTAVGKAVTVPEKYQDAVTAISGSGPAYLFFVVEAMIDAGVMLGLPRDTATLLVNQTVFGSAKLLVESGEHPTVLRERVTSPAGTTAAALRQLEERSVKAAFMTALEAARDRSAAMGG
ncbi:pyrroline-5-carboxylate reductase [Nigerium massiliense]|uniref:pyrroline-5-carboxylate reductase n=1 Tax=Nigerium massiliense TaxID=1522317 RepID=UPI000AFFD055|nr:pyrroline-5-carboxylate reductase [Nigerium massiliense]